MNKKRLVFTHATTLLIVFFAITGSSLSNAKESAQDGLQRCGLISDASARLACYDQLGGRKNTTDSKIVVPPALPKNEPVAVSLAARKEQQAEPESAIMKVTKCTQRGHDKMYIFYLEDGQVWRQISEKRLNFKDCNFDVSIHKDFFGYKMQLEDSNKKFRVKRIR